MSAGNHRLSGWLDFLSGIRVIPFTILGLVFISKGWLLFTGFMNDDIQIIGTTRPESLAEVFYPFISINVWEIYWRPVTESLLKFQLLIGGLNPNLFRLTTLILFSLASYLLYITALKAGLRERGAGIAAMLFILVPSHELNAAWISANGDLLAAIFLMQSFICWRGALDNGKGTGISAGWGSLSFLLAALSKEVGYAGVLIPLLALIAYDGEKIKKVRLTVMGIAIHSILVVLLLAYRYAFIGSDLFSAPHIQGVSVKALLINFLLYIPGSFLSPELMQIWFEGFLSPVNMFFILITAVLVVYTGYSVIRHNDKRGRFVLFFGAVWFINFIFPVLPVFMRWYPFIASAGLITALSYFIDKAVAEKKLPAVILAVLIISSGVYSYFNSESWHRAGVVYSEQVNLLKSESENISRSDTLYLFGVPDKAERVAVMKLGINETAEFALGADTPPLRVMLRCELFDSRQKIERQSLNGYEVLKLKEGRFMLPGMRSSAVLKNETANYEDSIVTIMVSTAEKGRGEFISEAKIYYKNPAHVNNSIFLLR